MGHTSVHCRLVLCFALPTFPFLSSFSLLFLLRSQQIGPIKWQSHYIFLCSESPSSSVKHNPCISLHSTLLPFFISGYLSLCVCSSVKRSSSDTPKCTPNTQHQTPHSLLSAHSTNSQLNRSSLLRLIFLISEPYLLSQKVRRSPSFFLFPPYICANHFTCSTSLSCTQSFVITTECALFVHTIYTRDLPR